MMLGKNLYSVAIQNVHLFELISGLIFPLHLHTHTHTNEHTHTHNMKKALQVYKFLFTKHPYCNTYNTCLPRERERARGREGGRERERERERELRPSIHISIYVAIIYLSI